MKKRGRPTLAAQTIDEALHNVFTGKAPVRPRNPIEREAMRMPKGRKPEPGSNTQQAAQLAAWLMEAEKTTAANASRQAAVVYKVNVDNVRRYLRKLLKGAIVKIDVKVPTMYAQLAPMQSVPLPLIADLNEVNAAFEDAVKSPSQTN